MEIGNKIKAKQTKKIVEYIAISYSVESRINRFGANQYYLVEIGKNGSYNEREITRDLYFYYQLLISDAKREFKELDLKQGELFI